MEIEGDRKRARERKKRKYTLNEEINEYSNCENIFNVVHTSVWYDMAEDKPSPTYFSSNDEQFLAWQWIGNKANDDAIQSKKK